MDGTPRAEREYYVIGRRPLDGLELRFLATASWPLEHRHFIANDGNNRGFFLEGAREDDPGYANKYQYYDDRKYDAQIMDEAFQIYDQRFGRDTVNKISEEILGETLKEGSMYHLLANNCQAYVKDVLKIARDIAVSKGKSLYYQ